MSDERKLLHMIDGQQHVSAAMILLIAALARVGFSVERAQ